MRCLCCGEHSCVCDFHDAHDQCEQCDEYFPTEGKPEVTCACCAKAPLCMTCHELCEGCDEAPICNDCINTFTMLGGPRVCPDCSPGMVERGRATIVMPETLDDWARDRLALALGGRFYE